MNLDPVIVNLNYGHFLVYKKLMRDWVQKTIVAGNVWEPTIIEVMEKYIKPGHVCMDIGANIGTHTVRMAQLVGESGRVIALEPSMVTFQQMCANLALNSLTNVRTDHLAVGDHFGMVEMSKIDYNSDSCAPGEVNLISGGGEQVQIVDLDLYTTSLGLDRLDFIKIDVERYETYVIKGAIETIRKFKPVIIFELTTLPLPEFPKDYVMDTLRDLGYEFELINDKTFDWLAIPK